MGGAIERWAQEQRAQRATTPVDNSIEQWADQHRQPDSLQASVHLSNPLKPDQAARIKFLQEKTGLAPDLISRNLEEVEQQAAQSDFDPAKFSARYPNTAKWLAEQPEHASVGLTDISHLKWWERNLIALGRGYRVGVEGSQEGDLHYKQMENQALSDADKQKLARIEADVQREPTGLGWWTGPVYEASKILGGLVNTFPDPKEHPVKAALAGGAGIAAAMAGPEIVTIGGVSTGLTAGTIATGGLVAGMASSLFKTNTGSAYGDLKALRGDNGEQINDTAAQNIAMGVGALSTFAMMVGGDVVAAPFKTGMQRFFTKTAEDVLVRPTLQRAMLKFGTAYAKNVAAGTGVMVSQELINILGEEGAKEFSSGDFDTVMNSPAQRERVALRLLNAMTKGAEAMSVMSLPGVAGEGARNYFAARQATRTANFFTALGEDLPQSKTFQLLPKEAQRLIERHTQDGPIEHVYIDAADWDSHWQSKKVDPNEVADRVLGEHKTLEEARESGGELQIPTARYAATIAPTESNTFFQSKMRFNALEMNREEAETLLKEEAKRTAPAEPAAMQQSAIRVTENITEQLKALGYDQESAQAYAALYGPAYLQFAQAEGKTPEQLFAERPVKISRPAPGQPGIKAIRSLNQEALSLDKRIEEMRSQLPAEPSREISATERFAHNYFLRKTPIEQWSSADLERIRQGNIEALHERGYSDTQIHDLMLKSESGFEKLKFKLREYAQTFNPKGGQEFDRLARDYRLAAIARRLEVEQALRSMEPLTGEFEQRPEGGEPRGRIQFGKHEISIQLLRTADPSTFIHETGHLFGEMLYERRNKTPQMKADFAALKEWMGGDAKKAFTREEHEQLAQGFEKYLLEGRAPVESLQGVFTRLKLFLFSVYRSLREIPGLALTPDVRHVFDRMLAAQDEIDAEQRQQPDMANEIMALGLSEEDAKAFQDAHSRAQAAAGEEIASKIMRDYRRETTKVFQAEREIVHNQVVDEAKQDATMRARALLEDGTQPGGEPLPEDVKSFKLSNKRSLYGLYGDEVLDRLKGMTAPDGITPDEAAERLGFTSGQELVYKLSNSEPVNDAIETKTTQRMRAQVTNLQPLTAKQLPSEAAQAVHNEQRAQLLRKTLEILSKQDLPTARGMFKKLARRIPTVEDIRNTARAIVDDRTVRSIQANAFARAERKAGNAAIDAMHRGDFLEAFNQKQRELLNHELFRAANDAQNFTNRAVDYLQRFDKDEVRARLGKARGKYLEQIDALRERFDFARVSNKALDRRESLAKYLDSQAEDALPTDVPDYLKEEAFEKNYKDLKFSELRDVYNLAKQIEHQARLKNTLLANEKERNVARVRQSLIERVQKYYTIKPEGLDLNPDLKKRTGRALDHIDAKLTKLEMQFKALDGHEANGPWWNTFVLPIQRAEDFEGAKHREANTAMEKIFGVYTPKERLDFAKKTYVKELSQSFTKPQLLALAFNWGNEGNRTAILEGYEKYGWTQKGVQAALDLLEKKDWDVAQGVWDHLATYRPDIETLERDVTGLAPEMVEASPVQTRFGEYRGGYYPLIFDSELNWRQARLDAEKQTKDMAGRYWASAMTQHGHTMARVGAGGKAPELSLNPLVSHLSNVIHDLAYRRTIIDLNKLIKDPDIRATVEGSLGKEYYRIMHPWLVDIAREHRGEYLSGMEKLTARARAGVTVVHIGLRLSSALVHIPALSTVFKEAGFKYTMGALAEAYGNPLNTRKVYNFITETSPFMKDRFQTFDRDLRDQMRGLKLIDSPRGLLTGDHLMPARMRAGMFSFIHAMVTGGSIPTWLAGYRRAMDGKVEGINSLDAVASKDYADSLVREVWSAGAIKDLAEIQRGSEMNKIWTQFYTYWSAVYQQQKKVGQQFRMTGSVTKLAAGAAAVWFIPAILSQLVTGHTPDDTSSPEEWLKWVGKSEVEWPFNTIPVVRDLVYPLVRGKGDFHPPPVFEIGQGIVKTGEAIENLANEEKEMTRRDWEAITDTAGYFLELPTKQAWHTLEALYDYITGEKQVENLPTDLFHSLVAQQPTTPEQVAETPPNEKPRRSRVPTRLDASAEPVFPDLYRA